MPGVKSPITTPHDPRAQGDTVTRQTRTYTDDEKTTALELYIAEGLATAHHETGIPRTNLRRWARRAGLDTAAVAQATLERIASAREASEAYREELREEIRTKLLEASSVALDRVLAEGETSRDFSPLAVATGILIDKYRLEMGEATGRSEVAHGDWRKEAAVAADELRKRRQEKAAG